MRNAYNEFPLWRSVSNLERDCQVLENLGALDASVVNSLTLPFTPIASPFQRRRRQVHMSAIPASSESETSSPSAS